MPLIRAQVVLPMFTNVPSDVITNTLNFDEEVPLTLEEAATALQPIIETFYRAVYSSDGFANYLSISTSHINFYRMDQPTPRVPVTTALFTTTMPSLNASTIPTETSIVLSFQGDRLGGTPQARRRGRIFLGGFATAMLDPSTTSSFPIIDASVRARIGDAATDLRDSSATATLPWVVWSETDQAAVVITNGWVDNSPDTQRRRSVEATARTLWT